jgi:DNA replication initiation complex subunit (GINS family)
MQLRDQLAKVNELAGNLESRVAHARQRAEEQVDNDFTRRVALITESLNSNAIDIAKALSTDVSDTAWASYLRGDRGIFTRRAVSLVDNAEAKVIAQIYERDREFHEHVSRYIHDFEAMLRQVLSARDGQALGVTLLSSDMGKLYVALAQAIQRLRS